MIYRSILLSVTLIGGHFLVQSIERGYSFGHVVPPSRELSEVPLQIGIWRGEELPEDPRLRKFMQARGGIDRVYTSDSGASVMVHAVWTDDYIRVHFPDQCYREAGWISTGERAVEIEPPGQAVFPARIQTFRRDRQEIQVLYWFQLGDHFFFDRWRHRDLRREVLWGRREWPPLMKFMLQTPVDGLGHSEEALRDIASQIYAALHAPPASPVDGVLSVSDLHSKGLP